MSQQIFVLLAVAFIACSLQGASAITCYQCRSLTDPRCADAVINEQSNVRTVDCATAPKPNSGEEYLPVTKCNKMTTSDRIGSIISRDCHFEVIGQKANECRIGDGRTVDNCYVCAGDRCNGDTTKPPSSTAALGAVGVSAAAIFAALAMRLMV